MSEQFIHFTESFSAGVMTSLLALTQSQLKSGQDVQIVFCDREFTPNFMELEKLFKGVTLLNLGPRTPRSLFGMLRYFLVSTSSNPDLIVHAHSSWAGMVIRTGNIFVRHQRVFFTPHSYAHLRTDISRLTEKIFRLMECGLGKFSHSKVIACSANEFAEARKLGVGSVILGGNYISDPIVELEWSSQITNSNPEFAAIGRITEAKNPERFISIALNSGYPNQFLWIGGGNHEKEQLFSDANISITGWLSPEDTLAELSRIYCLVITSDWEALPMVAIEAMGFGKPIISWNYFGVEEVVVHGDNGFICNSEVEMANYIELLRSDAQLHSRMSANSRDMFQKKFHVRILDGVWRSWYELS
jgi:glycosyltransferase involved in cell wall biosynthesis